MPLHDKKAGLSGGDGRRSLTEPLNEMVPVMSRGKTTAPNLVLPPNRLRIVGGSRHDITSARIYVKVVIPAKAGIQN
jgi:hypothetical protein